MTDFIRIPSNPIPDGAKTFMFAAPDGAKLRGAFFPVADARGTIVLEPGWAEFIEKYFETIGRLHARKFNVAMMDWRGQGLSDRESAREAKWKNYFHILREDLRHFTEAHVKPRFGAPMMLMTHSMGGMPALMLLADGYDGFERALLCAPMTRLFAGPANAVFTAVSAITSAIGLGAAPVTSKEDDSKAFEGNILTSDPARHERFRQLQLAEPSAANAAPTFGWVHAATKTSKEMHQPGFFDNLQIPVRIITAGEEKLIDGGDHATIAANSDRIERVIIPGALHEIMMERDEVQEPYWKAFDTFVATG
ncbi:MAG: alpha/beta hydrolase [Alphaproteobacteria bacterium]|nr:alpha/beta hydrolase [Alphaproteobacteria bacterium]